MHDSTPTRIYLSLSLPAVLPSSSFSPKSHAAAIRTFVNSSLEYERSEKRSVSKVSGKSNPTRLRTPSPSAGTFTRLASLLFFTKI